MRVSPAPGQRGVDVTKSMFREPMTQICGCKGWRGNVSLIPIFVVLSRLGRRWIIKLAEIYCGAAFRRRTYLKSNGEVGGRDKN